MATEAQKGVVKSKLARALGVETTQIDFIEPSFTPPVHAAHPDCDPIGIRVTVNSASVTLPLVDFAQLAAELPQDATGQTDVLEETKQELAPQSDVLVALKATYDHALGKQTEKDLAKNRIASRLQVNVAEIRYSLIPSTADERVADDTATPTEINIAAEGHLPVVLPLKGDVFVQLLSNEGQEAALALVEEAYTTAQATMAFVQEQIRARLTAEAQCSSISTTIDSISYQVAPRDYLEPLAQVEIEDHNSSPKNVPSYEPTCQFAITTVTVKENKEGVSATFTFKINSHLTDFANRFVQPQADKILELNSVAHSYHTARNNQYGIKPSKQIALTSEALADVLIAAIEAYQRGQNSGGKKWDLKHGPSGHKESTALWNAIKAANGNLGAMQQALANFSDPANVTSRNR